MASYTPTFNGSLKDAVQSTIQGADWDTEYEAISTAIATKANKDTGDTDELIKFDSNGDIVAAGSVGSNLSSLTDNIQDQIDGLQIPQNTTAHQPAGYVHLIDGTVENENESVSLWQQDGGGFVANASKHVGPTGSGAQNIWTALDVIPSTARIALIAFTLTGLGFDDSDPFEWIVNHSHTDTLRTYPMARLRTGTKGNSAVCLCYIPLDSSNTFRINYQQLGSYTGLVHVYATYRGYITTL